MRWSRYGNVRLDPPLSDHDAVVSAIRDYALDPDEERARAVFFRAGEPSGRQTRLVRVAAPPAVAGQGERQVELIRDAWGREHGVVFARRYLLGSSR